MITLSQHRRFVAIVLLSPEYRDASRRNVRPLLFGEEIRLKADAGLKRALNAFAAAADTMPSELAPRPLRQAIERQQRPHGVHDPDPFRPTPAQRLAA